MATELVSPVIVNLAITATLTEFPVTLPANVRQYTVRHRNATSTTTARMAFESGIVAAPTGSYFQLGASEQYRSPEKVGTSGQTLYFAATSTNSVIEILYWI